MPGSGRKEREKALRILHEAYPFVVQKKIDGLWETFVQSDGKTAAYENMFKCLKDYPGFQWRVISKWEADRYAEGVKAGIEHARRQREPRRPRRPAVYLPDNL